MGHRKSQRRRRGSRTDSGSVVQSLEACRLLSTSALLADLNRDGSSGNPAALKVIGSTLYFGATGGLWKSDGTAGGTVLLGGGRVSNGFANLGASIFYNAAPTGTFDNELWKSDGTAAG